MSFVFWEEDMMILMEFGEFLNGKYFLGDFWRKYLLMINISITILSSRKDSSKKIFSSRGELGWQTDM
jgi:hypothetical protein